MNPETRTWQPIDPTAGDLPAGIESALYDGDSVHACVVVLMDSTLNPEWGAQASLAVAKRWTTAGNRVILVDACLDRPMLHEVAGVENLRGASDMVLYQATMQDVAQDIGGGLLFAPTGTPVEEIADVIAHAHWERLIQGCRDLGATLVLHLSSDTPGAQSLAERAEVIVVLAESWRRIEAIPGSQSGPLIAVLGPRNGGNESADFGSVDLGVTVTSSHTESGGEPEESDDGIGAETADFGAIDLGVADTLDSGSVDIVDSGSDEVVETRELAPDADLMAATDHQAVVGDPPLVAGGPEDREPRSGETETGAAISPDAESGVKPEESEDGRGAEIADFVAIDLGVADSFDSGSTGVPGSEEPLQDLNPAEEDAVGPEPDLADALGSRSVDILDSVPDEAVGITESAFDSDVMADTGIDEVMDDPLPVRAGAGQGDLGAEAVLDAEATDYGAVDLGVADTLDSESVDTLESGSDEAVGISEAAPDSDLMTDTGVDEVMHNPLPATAKAGPGDLGVGAVLESTTAPESEEQEEGLDAEAADYDGVDFGVADTVDSESTGHPRSEDPTQDLDPPEEEEAGPKPEMVDAFDSRSVDTLDSESVDTLAFGSDEAVGITESAPDPDLMADTGIDEVTDDPLPVTGGESRTGSDRDGTEEVADSLEATDAEEETEEREDRGEPAAGAVEAAQESASSVGTEAEEISVPKVGRDLEPEAPDPRRDADLEAAAMEDEDAAGPQPDLADAFDSDSVGTLDSESVDTLDSGSDQAVGVMEPAANSDLMTDTGVDEVTDDPLPVTGGESRTGSDRDGTEEVADSLEATDAEEETEEREDRGESAAGAVEAAQEEAAASVGTEAEEIFVPEVGRDLEPEAPDLRSDSVLEAAALEDTDYAGALEAFLDLEGPENDAGLDSGEVATDSEPEGLEGASGSVTDGDLGVDGPAPDSSEDPPIPVAAKNFPVQDPVEDLLVQDRVEGSPVRGPTADAPVQVPTTKEAGFTTAVDGFTSAVDSFLDEEGSETDSSVEAIPEPASRKKRTPTRLGLVDRILKRGWHILLIEDDDDYALLVQKALEEVTGGKVDMRRARAGGEGLALLRERVPDLVILDLKMPGMGGHQVLDEIKGDVALRAVPIAVLSSSDRDEDVAKSYGLGGNHYITKPREPRQLEAKLASLLRNLQDLHGIRRGSQGLPTTAASTVTPGSMVARAVLGWVWVVGALIVLYVFGRMSGVF